MICREVKICLISADLMRKLKTAFLRFKIHILLLIALSIIVSSYQGKVISFHNTEEERHTDIFTMKIHDLICANEVNNFYGISIEKTLPVIQFLYESSQYHPVWTINYALNKDARNYINLLSNAHYYGLDTSEYHYESLKELQYKLETEKNYLKLAELRMESEILLTHSSIRFITALQKGILFERSACCVKDSSLYETIDFIAANLKNKNLVNAILASQPQTLQYLRLQRALEKYVKDLELSKISNEFPDFNHDNAKANELAKKILVYLSYAESLEMPEDYALALMKFQKNNDLKQNRVLDKKTYKALLAISEERLQKIAINLERLRQDRWSAGNYILVNIPAYYLKVVENNKEIAMYRTVIGKPVSPTPVFSSRISKIVTNPSWNVPRSITNNEILYKAKTDTTYLIRNQYVVYDEKNQEIHPDSINWASLNSRNFNYRIIQKSSDQNALGKLKFLFPNQYSVYVHDTPSKRLFNKDYRAFSHGCVRLENPHFLAEYIIKQQAIPNWEKQLKRNLNRGIQEIFILSKPIDIHLRYFTCEADEDGKIYYYEDIYELDEEILIKLNS